MTGIYTWKAIPPYCGEIRRRVEVVRWMGNRVLLREIERPEMLIDTDLASFTPDLTSDQRERLQAKVRSVFGGAK